MKKQNFFSIITRLTAAIILFGAVALAGALASYPASALDEKPDYRLQISPLQRGFGELKPGEVVEDEFEVQNTGNKAYSYVTEVAPYSVSGRDYSQNFTTMNEHTEMTNWVKITSGAEGDVSPNSRQTVKFSVTVPEDAPGGSQGAAVIVRMKDDADTDASAITAKTQIAYFFYANVAGDTRTTAEVLENKVPSILFNPPVTASSVARNTGNIYAVATYILEAREFFGDKLAYSNVTEDKSGNKIYETRVIFPDTERYAEITWDGAPQLGLFKVKQEIRIFDQVSTVEKIVFLCPIWFLIIILVLIGMVVYIIVSNVRRRKNNK